MKKLFSEKVSRIKSKKKDLERELNIKITNRGKEITIEGYPEEEYVAEKIFEALDFDFPFGVAMLIKNENISFEIINIKDHTKRKDLDVIRARIIGKKGRTLKTLSELTKCCFELKNNSIGIIGDSEHIKNAEEAIISLIKGARQPHVYSLLEKHQPKEIVDLGLK